MNQPKLTTYLSRYSLKTHFDGRCEGFAVTTSQTNFGLFTTEVEFDFSYEDPGDGNYVIRSVDSESFNDALFSHIELSRLVVNLEPIHWIDEEIKKYYPNMSVNPIAAICHRFFPSFKSSFSKTILALSELNPV